ncbi:SH3 domain and tetratricopeptide repeat-containing protein 1 isoform X2 [Thalassophryne amazonica]|uniref:SH3 domain and tetratricopeptide repeat-containing protein 1 isoform X2 n=1 Tax=Thalassophryne amazonica TaxID=390379 RepID=UPI001471ECAD|nr:SH3 domain and tetratricopeptide repeat-containing protein 1 isoform X2 [Thalassophryne amazonica]
MSARTDRGTGNRRPNAANRHRNRKQTETTSRSRMVHGVSRDAGSLKGAQSTPEESFPTVLPMLLAVVKGPVHVPADDKIQEMLRRKLCILQGDNTELNALFMELSAHLVSINSEEKVISVTFSTFEEIWKFTTYYTTGLVAQCMENLLVDQTFWLTSLEEDVAIEVSIQEETLNLIYKGILLHDGSLFASCNANQMFDSSTYGGDLYLEQGDIAQFEPPFLGSGWTVLSLADGARGTAPKPALEPVIPFHQWFLKSCSESILVGDGKPACDFPLPFARGTCRATAEYVAEGPEELSVAPGDCIVITGLLVSCFDWFTGKKKATGEVGLVKTSVVEPSGNTYMSDDIFLDEEVNTLFSLRDDDVIEETTAVLKKKSENDFGHNYKLDIINYEDSEKTVSNRFSSKVESHLPELNQNIQRILHQSKYSSPESAVLVTGTYMDLIQGTQTKDPSPLLFTVCPVVEEHNTIDIFIPLFSFLEGHNYNVEFGALYGLSPDLLSATVFTGHSDEDELISFLSVAREMARKKRLFWPHTRLCFLLGKLCTGRLKFSQARVYFEEALTVPREGFSDLRLLASIYVNLAAIYLLQKNREHFFDVAERLAALIMGIPDCVVGTDDDLAMKFILKKAILSHNNMAEARACYLLAKYHWTCTEGEKAIPYLERLVVLCAESQRTWRVTPSRGYQILGKVYSELSLPHLSVSSVRISSLQPSTTLTDCLRGMVLVLDNAISLSGFTEQKNSVPTQVVPYLHQALSFSRARHGEEDNSQYSMLTHYLTVCLCQLFYKHRMVGHAIHHMHNLIYNCPSSQSLSVSVPERNSALIWLAWLHIVNNQPEVALDILDTVRASMPEQRTSSEEGVVLNMCGVALRCMGNLRKAAESYGAALDICKKLEDQPNSAASQANLGLLCLKAGAKGLAERCLNEAVHLFSELDDAGHEENFIMVLLELGQHYVKQHQLNFGKACYEWALLLAISADLLDYQLTASRHLHRLYSCESPDQTKCIIYSQHQALLLTQTGDRGQEGDTLEAISRLYLSLGTDRAYRVALDYTKRSLGIFIDLGCKQKEAYGWLQAGRIYHMLGQTELVDLYVQVAQDVGLSTGDTSFILELLEAAGDVFFNSSNDQDKAVCFYRDRALPIAVKSSSTWARLRLCNKLTELMLRLKLYGEAVEFAQTALHLSITLGSL